MLLHGTEYCIQLNAEVKGSSLSWKQALKNPYWSHVSLQALNHVTCAFISSCTLLLVSQLSKLI